MAWIDCEMTGLDPDCHVLLEIASIITDYDLRIVATGPVVAIAPSPAALRRMDPWPRRTHTKTGLLDRARLHGVTLADAEHQTLNFVRRHCYARTAPFCGDSIGQDRRFLAKCMPSLNGFLNYRLVDVCSIKVLGTEWYGGRHAPPENSRTPRTR